MDLGVHERGTALLCAHCRNLDPLTPTALERLEEELGIELAQMLVRALASDGKRPASSRLDSGSRAVFAS